MGRAFFQGNMVECSCTSFQKQSPDNGNDGCVTKNLEFLTLPFSEI